MVVFKAAGTRGRRALLAAASHVFSQPEPGACCTAHTRAASTSLPPAHPLRGSPRPDTSAGLTQTSSDAQKAGASSFLFCGAPAAGSRTPGAAAGGAPRLVLTDLGGPKGCRACIASLWDQQHRCCLLLKKGIFLAGSENQARLGDGSLQADSILPYINPDKLYATPSTYPGSCWHHT